MKQNLSSAYSVHRAFEGSAVLITGATGYLGSLVLEQLLRLGHIRKAYLLMRRSSGHSEKQRLNLLLSTPIFRLHNLKQIVHRLEIIPGDLKQPDCGISHADQAKLVSGVQYIVHSAASIRFDNDIHTDIALSYVAMKSLAELARKIHGLRCFMYVSTAYANAHSDLVTGDVATMEQLYPLRNAIGLSLDHASVVELLLGLPPAEAQLEVVAIAGRHSSQQNNYGFCKNLTEQLIGSYHLQPFPVCINRPVGIGAVAKSPCPGYVGNSAATGVILSLACGVGTLQSHDAELPQPLVPGDMAASIILASMASAVEGCSCMESPYVTHACAMARHPVPFGEFVEHICKYFRDDPCTVFQFGDGNCDVRWTKDMSEYDRWRDTENDRIKQLNEELLELEQFKSANMVLTAWKVWLMYSDSRLLMGSTILDDSKVQRLVSNLEDKEKESLMLRFTLEDTGVTWSQYIRASCAGAKQLYMHEEPKNYRLEWYRTQEGLQSRL